jgi:hypothetical protein
MPLREDNGGAFRELDGVCITALAREAFGRDAKGRLVSDKKV